MDNKDDIVELEKERPNTHYEECDIPVIYFSSDISVDWLSYEDNKLKAHMRDGVQIPNKEVAPLIAELENLKNIYGFERATFNFVDRRDGTTSLVEICSGTGSYSSFIFGNEDDHSNDAIVVNPDNKIYIGELRSPEEALFFVECIAHYMKYFGVKFPHIQSRLIRTFQKEEYGMSREKRELAFSFMLPFVRDFSSGKSKYQTLVSNSSYLKSQDMVINENTILFGDKIVASLVHEKGKKKQYWKVGEITDSTMAIMLFGILSYPLKNRIGY